MSSRPRKILASVVVLGVAASLSACAKPPEPQYVRSSDVGKLGGTISLDRPIIVEFQEGDIIPLQFMLTGPFVRSPEGAPPIPLRVARHFFLRIDKDGLKSSTDGKDFDWKSVRPGQFQAGVSVTKEGIKANISIRTPTPPGLSP
jgi:hypothetical protein